MYAGGKAQNYKRGVGKELAQFFEVTETTINNWKNNYPDFFESIKKKQEIIILSFWSP